jgi:uncharacterized protein
MVQGAFTGLKVPVGLTPNEVQLICDVLQRHEKITGAILFGSRAKGTFSPESDVDIALLGVKEPLEAQAVASALEELPLPYRFDVLARQAIKYKPLLEHIERVGINIYKRPSGTALEKEA